MRQVFSHTVLITVTNVIIKAWLAVLYTLSFSASVFAITQLFTQKL